MKQTKHIKQMIGISSLICLLLIFTTVTLKAQQVSPYMGGEVELVTAPKGAIGMPLPEVLGN